MKRLAGDRQVRAAGRRRSYISRAHYCSHSLSVLAFAATGQVFQRRITLKMKINRGLIRGLREDRVVSSPSLVCYGPRYYYQIKVVITITQL